MIPDLDDKEALEKFKKLPAIKEPFDTVSMMQDDINAYIYNA